MFEGATIFQVLGLLAFCLLPAAATVLSGIFVVCGFFFNWRWFSLVSAIGCLVIYTIVMAFYAVVIPEMNLGHPGYHDFAGFFVSLPAGGLFRAFIPLATAIVVICFDLCVLKKRKLKGAMLLEPPKVTTVAMFGFNTIWAVSRGVPVFHIRHSTH